MNWCCVYVYCTVAIIFYTYIRLLSLPETVKKLFVFLSFLFQLLYVNFSVLFVLKMKNQTIEIVKDQQKLINGNQRIFKGIRHLEENAIAIKNKNQWKKK